MNPACYEPPYDSPIEEVFAWHCCKYLTSGVNLEKQVELPTQHGMFRADFILSKASERIEIECDGRDFHDDFRDEFRDAIILGERHVDTIYRFRGCDIMYSPDDCIWVISALHPYLFTQRGHLNLSRLCKLRIAEYPNSLDSEDIQFLTSLGNEDPYLFRVFRRTIHTKPNLNYHWKVLYGIACKHPDTPLDELVRMRMASWKTDIGES